MKTNGMLRSVIAVSVPNVTSFVSSRSVSVWCDSASDRATVTSVKEAAFSNDRLGIVLQVAECKSRSEQMPRVVLVSFFSRFGVGFVNREVTMEANAHATTTWRRMAALAGGGPKLWVARLKTKRSISEATACLLPEKAYAAIAR